MCRCIAGCRAAAALHRSTAEPVPAETAALATAWDFAIVEPATAALGVAALALAQRHTANRTVVADCLPLQHCRRADY